MANYQLLNNVDHAALRVRTERSAALGDAVWYSATFPAEFRAVQRHYPIVFTRHTGSGEYQPVALFGFEDGENLFLEASGWQAGYVPLNVVRLPFLVGLQRRTGQDEPEPVITVDLDNPRVNALEGERVFLEHGGSSPYIERIGTLLKALHTGQQQVQPFCSALARLGLLESFVMDVQLEDGAEHRLSGFHTINEEALHALDGERLALLHQRGWLEAVYMVLASMSKVQDLVERKQRRQREAAARG